MEPLEVAVEVFGSDAPIAAQESLEALMAAVHRLDVQLTPDPLTCRLIERLMGDTQRRGAGWIERCAIGDQEGLLAEHRRQDVFDRVGVDRGKDGADRGAGAVGGHQNRHLLTGQAAPAGFAAALAGLALRLLGIELPRSGIFPGARSLVAFQDISLVGLDDSAERGRIGFDRPQKAMPPAEGGAHRDVAPDRRLAHRFSLAQRPGEVEPASLVMQVCQRRTRQGVEGLAAPRAVEPTQAVRTATAHRPLPLAEWAHAVSQQAPFKSSDHFGLRRSTGQDLLNLLPLGLRQRVDSLDPLLVDPTVHDPPPSYVIDPTGVYPSA